MGRTGRSRDESTSGGAQTEYTIDDLSSATGVPSRTIRFYQAKGALPPPQRRGRVAYYNDQHIERLQLVVHLQDRGLNLRAIRDLFERSGTGDVSVSQWLGVGDQLSAAWTDDRPRLCTEQELIQQLGPEHRPGLITELARAGLIRREETTHSASFLIPSQAMLQIALRLEAAGISIEAAGVAQDILRRRIAQAAEELSGYFLKRASQREAKPEEIAGLLEALREIGGDAVRLVFAQEIERSLRDLVRQGRGAPEKSRRRRR